MQVIVLVYKRRYDVNGSQWGEAQAHGILDGSRPSHDFGKGRLAQPSVRTTCVFGPCEQPTIRLRYIVYGGLDSIFQLHATILLAVQLCQLDSRTREHSLIDVILPLEPRLLMVKVSIANECHGGRVGVVTI